MGAKLWSGQVPTSANNADGTPGIATATTVRFGVAGNVTGIEFRATTTVSGNYIGRIWQVTAMNPSGTGTLLGSTNSTASGSITAGAYNVLALTAPVAVTPGTLYRCGIHSSAGRYVATTSFFTSADLVNGSITADTWGDDPVGLGSLDQGSFAISATTTVYPNSSGNGTSYFVGPDFTASNTTISGSTSTSSGGLTGVGTGRIVRRGATVISLGSLSGAGAGAASHHVYSGSTSTSLGALSGAAAGRRVVRGSTSAAFGVLSGSGAGLASAHPVSGAGSSDLSALAGAANGVASVHSYTGEAQGLTGALSGSAAGYITVKGSTSVAFGALVGSGAGVATAHTYSGSGSGSMGALDSEVRGEGAATLVTGVAAVALGALAGQAGGVASRHVYAGSAGLNLGGLAGLASGSLARHVYAGVGSGPLGALHGVAHVLGTRPGRLTARGGANGLTTVGAGRGVVARGTSSGLRAGLEI